MPPEWAASGAKLGFNLEVGFTDYEVDMDPQTIKSLQQDAMMGSTLRTVLPLNQPSFVSASGTESIDVRRGAYGCQVHDRESKQYALRWYFDFPNGAKRNDVELPAERIYFLGRCWLPSSSNDGDNKILENAMKEKEQLLSDIELTNARYNKIRSTPPAGNIFGDIVQNAFNMRHMVVLIERKKSLQLKLDELLKKYPLDTDKVVEGPNDVTFAKEGVVAVKRSRQYHWIGTFSINEFS